MRSEVSVPSVTVFHSPRSVPSSSSLYSSIPFICQSSALPLTRSFAPVNLSTSFSDTRKHSVPPLFTPARYMKPVLTPGHSP